MNKSRKISIKRKVLLILSSIICVLVFLVSFGNNSAIPTWNDIFSFFHIAPDSGKSNDYVSFINVGQGDSILIYSDGYSAIIDSGPEESETNLCRDINLRNIKQIDVALTTHLHMDHVGGLKKLILSFDVKNLILPDLTTDSEGFPAAEIAKRTITESKGGVYTAVQGMNLNIGKFEITVLAAYYDLENENDRSVVCMAKIGNNKFLLMGDAEASAEARLISDNINVKCDVLKVGHHGSKTSSTKSFLQAASPRYAVISVGANNKYSHPNQQTLDSLNEIGAKVFRTDINGDITFYVDNNKFNIVLQND